MSLFATISLALHEMRERLLRSILTACGIAFAVGSFVAVDGVVKAFERALVGNVAAIETHLEVTEQGSLDFLSSIVPLSAADGIEAVDGVSAVSPMLIRVLPIASGVTVPVVGWPENAYLWDTVTFVSGRKPKAGDPKEAALGTSVAKRLNIPIGGKISVMGVDLTVVGLVDTQSQINRSSAFVILSELQDMTYHPQQATTIAIRLTPSGLRELPRIKSAIEAMHPVQSVVDTDLLTHDNFLVTLTSGLSHTMSIIAIALAFFGVANTTWTAARERRHEFAVMRVFGWPIQRIALFMLVQSLVVTAAGFVGGLILGYFGAGAVAGQAEVGPFLEPRFEWGMVTWAIGAFVIVGILATLLPLWTVSRTDPATTLRSP